MPVYNLYATLTQLKKRLIAKVKADGSDDTELEEILEAVSRLIDNSLGVVGGYFTPQSTPATKRVYGTGSSFITLPAPLSGEVTITAPSGYTVPNFTIEGQRLIALTDEDHRSPFIIWAKGVYFDIEGVWGYTEVRPEVREACLQIAVRFWRGRDEAFSGVIGGIQKDGSIIERDLPAPVRRILGDLKSVIRTKRGGGLVLA